MSRFVRPSKYRHVFGQPAKKEHCLENLKVSNSAWDTNLVAVSANYISINWNASGGGAFAILPLPSPFRPLPHFLPYKLPDVIPLARGHTAPVLDTAWSAHNDSLVASAGEDGKILLWSVTPSAFDGWGAEGWVPEDFDATLRIDASPRKVGQLVWHPTAEGVLAAASGEHSIKLWDLSSGGAAARTTLIGHADTIQSMAFNSTGTLLATTSRDRKLRIFDPRAGGEAVRLTEGHGGIKGARVCWMGERDNIATTGFSKMSDREVAVWETGGLGVVKKMAVDQSAGVVMPFWSDNSILFLAGKGDGNIRFYEWDTDTLHPLSEHKSADPQRGMCFLPRRALNVADCEIARAYKVTAQGGVEPIAFVVPRKSDTFQSDIFPPAPSAQPSLSASDFFAGKIAGARYVDLDTGAVSTGPSAPTRTEPTRTSSAPAPVPAQAQQPVQRSVSNGNMDPSPPATATTTTYIPPSSPETRTPARQDSASASAPAPAPAPAPTRDILATSHTRDATSTTASPTDDTPTPRTLDDALIQLRAARAQIRMLELQIETMRANAAKAAALLG